MKQFTWATVTGTSPLRVQLDGDAAELPITPDSLADPAALAVGDRMRCEVAARRVIVHGRAGGSPRPGLGNRVINGALRVNQRGAASGAALASGQYFIDRWRSTSASNAVTWTGDEFAGRVLTIPSGKSIATTLERGSVPAGTYTLGIDGTARLRVYKVGSTPPAYAAGPFTVALDGSGDVVVEASAVGGSATLSNVRMDVGVVDPGFRLPSFAEELRACQRYYYQIASSVLAIHNPYFQVALSGGPQIVNLRHPVPMRATPTINNPAGTGAETLFTYYNYSAGAAGDYYAWLTATADGFGAATYASTGGNGGTNLAMGRTMGLNKNPIFVSAEL